MATLGEAVMWAASWRRQLLEICAEVETRKAELASTYGDAAFHGVDGGRSERDIADRAETAAAARRLDMAVEQVGQAVKQLEAFTSRSLTLSDNVREVEARRAEARRKLAI